MANANEGVNRKRSAKVDPFRKNKLLVGDVLMKK